MQESSPEPSLVPYNNIHQGNPPNAGFEHFAAEYTRPWACREGSDKRAWQLLLRETITAPSIEQRGPDCTHKEQEASPKLAPASLADAVLGRATCLPNNFKQRNEERRVSAAVYI